MGRLTKSFALGDPKTKRVELWCSGSPVGEFHVINGNWGGWRASDGSVTMATKGQWLGDKVCEADTAYPITVGLLWQGDAPFPPQDYNEAIAWIEAQLTRTRWGKLKAWAAKLLTYRLQVDFKLRFVPKGARPAPVNDAWEDDLEIPF